MNFAPDKKCVSPSTNVYRLALKKNVAVATLEAGYDGARNNAVELMTDHLQTCEFHVHVVVVYTTTLALLTCNLACLFHGREASSRNACCCCGRTCRDFMYFR